MTATTDTNAPPRQSRPLIDLIEVVASEPNLGEGTDIDYFEDSLTSIFNDARNQHGDPGEHVLYKCSNYFGKDIKLRLADPKKEDNKLFAHFLWNAGVQAAEMIASGEWDVRGKRVLELGAGAGLPGIVAALAGASEVVSTDYPAPELLSNVLHNIKLNLSPEIVASSNVSVRGHIWGELDVTPDSQDAKATIPLLLSNTHAREKFDRIIVADCMWMDWQHGNLCSSIVHFLEPEHGEVLAIAGFHTGRPKLANFYKVCEQSGLELIATELTEKDVDGNERVWDESRKDDLTERKKWLTIGTFRMRREH